MPGIKPKEKVKRAWSPSLAYAVGLLTSDGCLSKDGRHLDFTSKDLDQIRTFKKCLGLKNKVGQKNGGFSPDKKYFRVQFGDVLFYNWLLKLGLSPNKSKIVGKLDIPSRYFFDFLRGCFDGDGSINAYWDPRWHSSYMFYLRIFSASLNYLKWLRRTICQLCGASGKIKTNTRQYELVFAKRATGILIDKMFYSAKLPCLKRKLLKIERIFKINNEHDNARVVKLGNAPA